MEEEELTSYRIIKMRKSLLKQMHHLSTDLDVELHEAAKGLLEIGLMDVNEHLDVFDKFKQEKAARGGRGRPEKKR